MIDQSHERRLPSRRPTTPSESTITPGRSRSITTPNRSSTPPPPCSSVSLCGPSATGTTWRAGCGGSIGGGLRRRAAATAVVDRDSAGRRDRAPRSRGSRTARRRAGRAVGARLDPQLRALLRARSPACRRCRTARCRRAAPPTARVPRAASCRSARRAGSSAASADRPARDEPAPGVAEPRLQRRRASARSSSRRRCASRRRTAASARPLGIRRARRRRARRTRRRACPAARRGSRRIVGAARRLVRRAALGGRTGIASIGASGGGAAARPCAPPRSHLAARRSRARSAAAADRATHVQPHTLGACHQRVEHRVGHLVRAALRQVLEVAADRGRARTTSPPSPCRPSSRTSRRTRSPAACAALRCAVDEHRHHRARRILAVLRLGLIGRRHDEARRPRAAPCASARAPSRSATGRAWCPASPGPSHCASFAPIMIITRSAPRCASSSVQCAWSLFAQLFTFTLTTPRLSTTAPRVVLEVDAEHPRAALGRDLELLRAVRHGRGGVPRRLRVGARVGAQHLGAVRGHDRACRPWAARGSRARGVVAVPDDELDRGLAVGGLRGRAADAVQAVRDLDRRDRVRRPVAGVRPRDRLVAVEAVRRRRRRRSRARRRRARPAACSRSRPGIASFAITESPYHDARSARPSLPARAAASAR